VLVIPRCQRGAVRERLDLSVPDRDFSLLPLDALSLGTLRCPSVIPRLPVDLG
jgi:hypothetical protein